MKIGIFAGTFDPIHKGHVEFAKSALEQAHLDKVVIVAEKEPYRKKPHTSWDHRQAMIERSTQEFAQVDHNYSFANQLAHKHTMKDMLQVASKHYGPENEIWFLVGSDLFEHMHQWHDLVSGHEYGGFVVALRDDHTTQWLNQKIEQISANGIQANTIVITNTHPHVSSSAIRTAIKNGLPNTDITKNIRTYIDAHNLYK